jgi:hypothetical protein
MSTVSLILFVISGLFLTWQLILVGLAFSYVKSGRGVRIPLVPLIISATAAIIGILVR